MASRDPRYLSVAMQRLYADFMDRCEHDAELLKDGISVLLTCTYRSNEEQDALYAQGRTKPGSIVTKAKGGQSKHNAVDESGGPAAEAFDVVPLLYGKPIWRTNDDPNTPENEAQIWKTVGNHGVAAGLKWYGSPGSPFPEYPHFQNPKA